jgi:hypothetical protein
VTDGFIIPNPIGKHAANPVQLGLTDLAVVTELEPNDAYRQAQRVSHPVEVAGRFYPRADRDWLEFDAEQGDDLHLELISYRLGHPVDPQLLVYRAKEKPPEETPGTHVEHADDGAKLPGPWGLDQVSLDPIYRLQVPEAGRYRICVLDQQSGPADPRNAYRLRIRPRRPDFRMIAATLSPWNANPEQPLRWPGVLRRGGAKAIEVWIVPEEGWTGPVDVVAHNLPPGVTAAPLRIPAGSTSGTLVLQAADQAGGVCQPIRIEASGQQGDNTLVRQAQPVTFVWDTAKPRGLTRVRKTADLLVCVAPEMALLTLAPAGELRYQVAQGMTLDIPMVITQRAPTKGKLEFTPTQLPTGMVSSFEIEDPAKTSEEAKPHDKAEENKSRESQAAGQLTKVFQARWRLTIAADCPVGEYSLLLAGKPKISYRRLPVQAALAAERQQHLEERVTVLATARQQAEQRVQEGVQKNMAAGELDALKEAAGKSVQDEQAGQKARDAASEWAKKMAAAAKATDRLDYVVSPPIRLTVTPPPKEPSP